MRSQFRPGVRSSRWPPSRRDLKEGSPVLRPAEELPAAPLCVCGGWDRQPLGCLEGLTRLVALLGPSCPARRPHAEPWPPPLQAGRPGPYRSWPCAQRPHVVLQMRSFSCPSVPIGDLRGVAGVAWTLQVPFSESVLRVAGSVIACVSRHLSRIPGPYIFVPVAGLRQGLAWVSSPQGGIAT